jgi:hypothetical protein
VSSCRHRQPPLKFCAPAPTCRCAVCPSSTLEDGAWSRLVPRDRCVVVCLLCFAPWWLGLGRCNVVELCPCPRTSQFCCLVPSSLGAHRLDVALATRDSQLVFPFCSRRDREGKKPVEVRTQLSCSREWHVSWHPNTVAQVLQANSCQVTVTALLIHLQSTTPHATTKLSSKYQ